MNNNIGLNFDGKITNDQARKNLHVPVITKKTPVNTIKTIDGSSYSVTETMVKVSDLYLDLSYQRKPNDIKVKSIAKNFNPDAFGVIICSVREDNIIAIIDGGHRIAALRMLGFEDQTVNALVYFELSIQDEARIFTLINDERTKPKTSDIFKAEVVSGDKSAVEIDEILKSLNLEPSNGPGHNKIRGLATLKQLHKDAGGKNLKDSLLTLTEAFGNHSSSYNIDLLSSICLIYKKNPNIDKSRMVNVLKKFGDVDIIIGQAKNMSIGSSKPIKYTTLCTLIVNSYNTRLKANRLQDYQVPSNMNKIWE